MRYIIGLLAAVCIWFTSCSRTNEVTSNPSAMKIDFAALDMKTGETIVQTVCISCHDPKASVSDRIAPPLEIIKRNYLAVSENEREFIGKLTAFVLHPTEEQAELHSDIDEYGLMDPLGYSKEEIQSVAMFIYRTELERPDWMGPDSNQE